MDYFLNSEQYTLIELILVIDSYRIEDLKIISEEELVAQAFEEAFKVAFFNYGKPSYSLRILINLKERSVYKFSLTKVNKRVLHVMMAG